MLAGGRFFSSTFHQVKQGGGGSQTKKGTDENFTASSRPRDAELERGRGRVYGMLWVLSLQGRGNTVA